MNRNVAKYLLFLCLSVVITGCKLAVMVPSGGDVMSASGTRNCLQGSNCTFNVTDADLDETFTVVPKSGYRFSKWKAGDGYLCGNSTSPTCVASNTQFAGNAQAEAVIASDAEVKLEPVFQIITSPVYVVKDGNGKEIEGNVLNITDGGGGRRCEASS